MGIKFDVAQTPIVTFASAFKQKIMNNEAQTFPAAITAFSETTSYILQHYIKLIIFCFRGGMQNDSDAL